MLNRILNYFFHLVIYLTILFSFELCINFPIFQFSENEIQPPENIKITSYNNTSTIKWDEINQATSYNIYRSNIKGFTLNTNKSTQELPEDTRTVLANTSVNSFIDNNIINGEKYYYSLSSLKNTIESKKSDEIELIVVPLAPTIFSATLSNKYIELSWETTNGALNYKLYRSISLPINLNVPPIFTTENNFYKDEDLSSNTTYYYTIVANNKGGDSVITSSTLNRTTFAGAPKNFTVTAVNTIATIIWDSVTGAIGYNIYRSNTSGFFPDATTKINNLPLATLSYTDNLLNGTGYYYRLTTVNVTGESLPTVEKSLLIVPMSISNFTSNVLLNKIDLTWTKVIGANFYKLYKSTNIPSIQNLGVLIESINGATNTYSDFNTQTNTTYYYSIIPNNSAGDSISYKTVSALTLPAQPTGLNLYLNILTNVNIAWSAPVDGTTNYYVYRAAGAPPLTIASNRINGGNVINNTIFTEALTPGYTYYYVVTSKNATGESLPTAPLNITLPPSAPTTIALSLHLNNVYLNWNSVFGSVSYKIFRNSYMNISIIGHTPIAITSNTNYIDTTAKYGDKFYYQVVASNQGGDSSSSTELLASIPVEPLTGFSYSYLVTEAFTSIKFNWNSSEGATNYKLYQNNTLKADLNSNVLTTNISYISDGETYKYTLYAFNSWASTAPVFLNILGSPPVPVININSNTLNWASVKSATSYKVYRSTSSSFTPTDTGVGVNLWTTVLNNSVTDNTFNSNITQTYYYKVIAVNSIGVSGASNGVSITYTPFSITPTSITASWASITPNITLTTTYPWSIQHNTLSWVSLSKTSGSWSENIKVYYKDNIILAGNPGYIPFQSGGSVIVLTINQARVTNISSTPGFYGPIIVPPSITKLWITLWAGDGGNGGKGATSSNCVNNFIGSSPPAQTSALTPDTNNNNSLTVKICTLSVSSGQSISWFIGDKGINGFDGVSNTGGNGGTGPGSMGTQGAQGGTDGTPNGCKAGGGGGGGAGGGISYFTLNVSTLYSVYGGKGVDGGGGANGVSFGTYTGGSGGTGGLGQVPPASTLCTTSTPSLKIFKGGQNLSPGRIIINY